MHGCTSQPDDIVLTREDYLRYSSRRSALRGIVQSLLITRHMLFAGFSLKDTNFHIIADEVRQALRSQTPARNGSPPVFGSALQLTRNPLTEMLWSRDLQLISMINHSEGTRVGTASAAGALF